MWMSMRSNNGPEIRFWYLVTTAGAHVQAFCGSEKYPQGQGYTQSDNYCLRIQNQGLSDVFSRNCEKLSFKARYNLWCISYNLG